RPPPRRGGPGPAGEAVGPAERTGGRLSPGTHEPCQQRELLSRWETSRFSELGQYGAGVGRSDWKGGPHAEGIHGRGRQRDVLSGWHADRLGEQQLGREGVGRPGGTESPLPAGG